MRTATVALRATVPSIIPSPGEPDIAGSAGQTASLIGGVWTVDEDQILYTADRRDLLQIWSKEGLVNEGTLWVRSTTGDAYALYGHGMPSVVNDGLIVAEATGTAFGIYQTDPVSPITLTNTGRIFALSAGGFATGIQLHPSSTVTNSGLIAAQCLNGSATGLRAFNCELTNTSTGAILAEGDDAIAAYVNGGSVTNAGRIEAVSTDAHWASIGLALGHHQSTVLSVVNTGVIRGDYSIVSGFAWSPPQKASEHVTNEAGGLLDGSIWLDLGDDLLVNRGRIVGNVYMGEGEDRVDTSAGTLNGLVDLGWGDDVFVGSTLNDTALGERDDDEISGGGGDDLLIGGFGDDVLIGGDGSDGLFGEFGADRIVTQGADFVWGGTGDDRIEAGDLAFELIDGGEGFDTLVMPTGARVLDLQAALADGRIANIEAVQLSGGQGLVIRPGDVGTLSGATQMLVGGTGSDHVDLVGAWIEGPTATVNGLTYRSFTAAGSTVLVQMGAVVAVGSAPPAGASGLDSIGLGELAPLPGERPGTGLTSATTVTTSQYLTSSLVISAEETWRSANAGGVYDYNNVLFCEDGSVRIDNYGSIVGDGAYTGRAILIMSSAGIYNHGLIGAYAGGVFSAVAIDVHQTSPIWNGGRIEAVAVGDATAVISWAVREDGDLVNAGQVDAHSENGRALGWDAHTGSDFTNSGEIVAEGAQAIAVRSEYWGTITNTGTITATAHAGQSVGLQLLELKNTLTVVNRGRIAADVAIEARSSPYNWGVFRLDNSGEIIGRVLLDLTSDVVTNNGSIQGDVQLGGGDDRYDGRAGVQTGGVYGDLGRDTLLGGAGREDFFGGDGDDELVGGKGDDVLDGGAGDDVLDGGDGYDTAVYAGAASGVKVNLSLAGAQNTGGAGTDTLIRMNNITGSAFADALTGDGGANALIGGDGDDVLDGGAGADRLDGGDGYDTAVYASAASGVRVNLSLTGAQNTGGAGTDTLSRIENLTGSAFADTLTGNGGANVLTGGKGDDVLDGGAGDDVLDGGDGYDTAVYAGATSGVRVNLSLAGAQNTGGAGTDTLIRMNNLTGSAFADTLTGDQWGNTLVGGKGDDVLDGGAGNDVLDGGDGYDTAVYAGATSGVKVNLSLTGAQNTGGAGTDTLIRMNNITGSAFADVLTGDQWGNTLIGGGGDDFLDGGAGADRLDGGDGYDTAVYAGATSGVKVNLALTGAQNTGGAGSDTLILIDNVTGSAFADTLTGNGGANVLTGGKGDDLLEGGGGDDRLDGGDGYDTAVYASATSGVTVNLSLTGAQNTGGAGIDTLIRMNNITGSNFADVLTGDQWGNTLIGGKGDDVLEGGGGNDRLDGGDGYDTALYASATSGVTVNLSLTGAQNTGGAGIDTLIRMNNITGSNFADVLTGDQWGNTLIGGQGDDVLDGGGGNDRLTGGAGNDVMTGGAGDDLFVFGPAFGHDRIDDFVAGGSDDRLDFSAFAGTGVTWTLTQVGEDAVFAFSDGSTLTLAHVLASSLTHTGTWGWG